MKFNRWFSSFIIIAGMSATSAFAQLQPLPRIVSDASQYLIRGCVVKLNVSGWANQLYVNGAFSGNFQRGIQDQQLANAIDMQFRMGRCFYKSPAEISLIQSPTLIDDFVRQGTYRNCYVMPYVSGWANQVYVNGNFTGNFRVGEEDQFLRATLADYVTRGVCVRNVPSFCTCQLSNPWGYFQASGPTCDIARSSVLNQCSASNPHAVCQGSQAVCR